jgi:predicted cupin superfamily sugar epimerase
MSEFNSLQARLLVVFILLSACARGSFAQINITTERYDQSRLGANLSETQLNASNVNVNTFGKLWSYQVSGSVHAQPLYVQNVTIPGKGSHNVLYVVTMNDVVYAFDADSGSSTPLLSLDLTTQVGGSTPVPITDIVGPGLNIVGNVGIESTPYIDLSTNTMYLVARTKQSANTCGTVNGNYCQRLHALDITTFAEKFGGPVVIQGSVSGTGDASVGGTLTFDPKIHNQRSSLALANGQISIGWASHEDQNPYHGWVMSYNASNLQQTGIWSSSPDGFMAGVWMSGRGPAVDASGNVYYMVGNGDWNGTRNFGESMLKFGSTNGMSLLDWFTPDSWPSLNAGDIDYGSSGPILIPGTDLIAGAGKASVFYVMHTGNLGHEQTGNGQIVQSLANGGGEVKGGPVYWNRSGGAGPWMYVWSNGCDFLKAYHFNGTTFDTGVVSESTIASPCGASGGVLTLSANGSTAGSGIIWSSMPLADDGDHGVHQGVLRALNADDLTKELWNSRLNATRDDSGNWPKYSAPTVVNGRVYMASFPADGVSSAPLNVYGLLPTTPDFTISATPASQGVNPGGSTSYTVSTSSIFNFSAGVTLSVTGLPSGASASFAANNFAPPGSTKLIVNTSSSTPLGTSTLTITGTSGSLRHTAGVSLVVTTTTPGTGAISIDFVGRDTSMSPTEVAGVVPKSNWNEAQGSSGNGFALVDETGAPTGATVSWTSSPVWSLPIADTPGNFRMMSGYLDTVGQNTTVTVAGLPASAAGYDVYVYADGDNGGATRTGTYQISGTSITTTSINLIDAANTNFSGTFTQANNSAGNYVVFSIATTGFTLTAIPSTASDGTQRAPVNGMQIIPHAPVPDFILGVSPSSQTVQAGNSASYTVTTTVKNSFNGTVTLSASGLPSGATASFSPSTITGAGTSTLTILTGSAAASGTATLTISGTSGSQTHTAMVSLVVTTTTPGTGAISIDFVGRDTSMSPTEVAGVVPKSNWNEAQGSSGNGFALVDETGAPTGATVSWTSSPVWSLPIADTPGNFRMMNGYLDTVGQNTTVTVAGLPANAAGYDVYVYADGDNGGATRTGTYQISGTSITTTSINLIDAANTNFSGTFTQANNSAGNYVVFSIATTGFTLTAIPSTASDGTQRAPVNGMQIIPHGPVPDFTLAVSPPSQTVQAGNPATYTVTTTAKNSFNGTITLSASGVPSGATASFSPATITGAGTSTLTVSTGSATAAGTSTLTVSGSSGSLGHSASVMLVVNTLTPAPNPAFSPAGGSYSLPQSVTITASAAGATIYYTTNGSTPTTSSTQYTGAISVSATTTVKAIATATGFSTSAVASATYTISGSLSPIPQAGWTLKFVDSQETIAENGAATNAFDGKTNTFWHTQWSGANPPPPHEIQISLGASYSISGFTYLPRQDGCSHGDIKQYEFYISTDGANWGNAVAAGTFGYGTFTYNCPGGTIVSARVVTFPAVTGSFVRLRALSEMGGNPWTSVAELNVLH